MLSSYCNVNERADTTMVLLGIQHRIPGVVVSTTYEEVPTGPPESPPSELRHPRVISRQLPGDQVFSRRLPFTRSLTRLVTYH